VQSCGADRRPLAVDGIFINRRSCVRLLRTRYAYACSLALLGVLINCSAVSARRLHLLSVLDANPVRAAVAVGGSHEIPWWRVSGRALSLTLLIALAAFALLSLALYDLSLAALRHSPFRLSRIAAGTFMSIF